MCDSVELRAPSLSAEGTAPTLAHAASDAPSSARCYRAPVRHSALRTESAQWALEFSGWSAVKINQREKKDKRTILHRNKDTHRRTQDWKSKADWLRGEFGDSHGGGGSEGKESGAPWFLLENLLFSPFILGRFGMWRREDLHRWGKSGKKHACNLYVSNQFSWVQACICKVCETWALREASHCNVTLI